MKRKTPVELCLVDSESTDQSIAFDPPFKILKRNINTHFKSFTIDVTPHFIAPPSRPCTPSPPMSPVHWTKKGEAPKSLLRQSNRKLLAKYRDCKELVEPQRDLSIASDYEMLLFSHMIMETGPDPSFRCRCCPQSSASTFSCKSVGDLMKTIPEMEQHLMECKASPAWLPQGIVEAKAKHASQICPRKPYSHLVWKRILAFAIYSRVQYIKRVKFAEQLCHERIIPARERRTA